jgi:hypothetical protein
MRIEANVKTALTPACEESEKPELYFDLVLGLILGNLLAYAAYDGFALFSAIFG